MRSEPNFIDDVRPSELPRWPVDRAIRFEPEAGENPLRLRQVDAAQRHRDLDDAISMLSQACLTDELLIARLKKRKLQIKDEIARIARLLPS